MIEPETHLVGDWVWGSEGLPGVSGVVPSGSATMPSVVLPENIQVIRTVNITIDYNYLDFRRRFRLYRRK